MRRIAVTLIAAGLLSAIALAGGGKPQAKVLSVEPFNGELVNVTLLVRDRQARPVDLLVEYKVRGVKGWQPAAPDRELTGVPASPLGTEFAFRWLAYDDLGCSYRKKARLRVTVTAPKGRKKKSKKTELKLYGEVEGTDLREQLLDPESGDLIDNGSLDTLVLIDTRAPGDFSRGAIPGARSIQYADILERGRDALPWPDDTRLVFTCYGGS